MRPRTSLSLVIGGNLYRLLLILLAQSRLVLDVEWRSASLLARLLLVHHVLRHQHRLGLEVHLSHGVHSVRDQRHILEVGLLAILVEGHRHVLVIQRRHHHCILSASLLKLVELHLPFELLARRHYWAICKLIRHV